MRKLTFILSGIIAALAVIAAVVFWDFLSSGKLKNFVETLAVLVGGGWAVWRFILRRESKPALEISLTYKTIQETKERFLAYFDVVLTNKSTCRVVARRRKKDVPAFTDKYEHLQHSCCLILRHIPKEQPAETQIRWFPADEEAKSPRPDDIVANLLDEYEDEVIGQKDFFMEPSEIYHLCVGVVLKSGTYLAMVTFLGDHGDEEFWRLLSIVQIPERPETK